MRSVNKRERGSKKLISSLAPYKALPRRANVLLPVGAGSLVLQVWTAGLAVHLDRGARLTGEKPSTTTSPNLCRRAQYETKRR